MGLRPHLPVSRSDVFSTGAFPATARHGPCRRPALRGGVKRAIVAGGEKTDLLSRRHDQRWERTPDDRNNGFPVDALNSPRGGASMKGNPFRPALKRST